MSGNGWMLALAATLVGLSLMIIAAPHLAHPEPRLQYSTAAPW